jgi:tetratricopeptide (TPR) repeat protein
MRELERLKQALAARHRKGTNEAVAELLACRAPLGPQWRGISELMRLSGEVDLAHRTLDAFVASAGGSPPARFAKAVLCTQTGRMQEAHDIVAGLPPDVPDRGGRAYVLGNTALALGRVEAARHWLEEAVHHRPGWGPAWLTLASATPLATTEALGERLLADAAAAQRQGPADLARYCYAVGKLHMDRRQPAAAFDAFARGAHLLRTETPYSRRGNTALAEAAMTGVPEGWVERHAAQRRRDTSRPIFVTGLPRSGTTLVEQILASHSAVSDGAELNLVQQLALQVGGVSGDALEAYLTRGGHIDDVAALYLHLLTQRCGSGGRVVDKTVDASRYLGLVAAALPDAPLIWLRRDPMDNAWSCLRTFFIHGVGWSYDLADIAHHFRLEDRLLAFWQERLGPRLLVVPYAELVTAPEPWTRRLLAHCGLADEPGPYRPHATDRVVLTASAMQVRQPIHAGALGTADAIRTQMQPFVEAYAGVNPD